MTITGGKRLDTAGVAGSPEDPHGRAQHMLMSTIPVPAVAVAAVDVIAIAGIDQNHFREKKRIFENKNFRAKQISWTRVSNGEYTRRYKHKQYKLKNSQSPVSVTGTNLVLRIRRYTGVHLLTEGRP